MLLYNIPLFWNSDIYFTLSLHSADQYFSTFFDIRLKVSLLLESSICWVMILINVYCKMSVNIQWNNVEVPYKS